MIPDNKINELNGLLNHLLDFNPKEQKQFEVELLYKYVARLEKFEEFNKKEINKLILLLEYVLQSAIDKDDKLFDQRFKALRRHAQKNFKVYHKGELQSLGIGSGVAIGVAIGVALSSGFRNVGLGIPIGIGVGIPIGVAIGNSNEERANKEGRIL